MLGKLEVEGGEKISAFLDPNKRNLVSEVSITEPRVFGKGNAVKVRAASLGLVRLPLITWVKIETEFQLRTCRGVVHAAVLEVCRY